MKESGKVLIRNSVVVIFILRNRVLGSFSVQFCSGRDFIVQILDFIVRNLRCRKKWGRRGARGRRQEAGR